MRWHERLMLIGILATAAFARLYGLGLDSFAHDEAWRANWSHHGDWGHWRRFPPMQALLLYAVQHALGRGEAVMRAPFAIAGIATVALLFSMVRRCVDVRAALMAAALAALHPVLIQYSRSIKEFSFEALACVVVLWAGWVAYLSPSRRRVVAFGIAGAACAASAFTAPLIAAAWLPVLAWRLLGDRSQRPLLGWYAGSTAAVMVTTAACYVWYSGCTGLTSMRSYYDTQEIMFPAAHTPAALASWTVSCVKGVALFVLDTRDDWPPLSWCAATVWAIAIAAACGVMIRRHTALCVVGMIIALELLIVGGLRLFPVGRVRTMTFLVPVACLLIGCGLAELVRRVGWSAAAAALLGLAMAIPGLDAARSVVLAPRLNEHIRPAIGRIHDGAQPGDAIFVYYGATDAFEYYAGVPHLLRDPDDPAAVRTLAVTWGGIQMPVLVEPLADRENRSAFAERFDRWIAQHRRVWFLFAHDWKGEHREWVDALVERYERVDSVESVNASVHLFARPEHALTAGESPAAKATIPE